MVKLLNYSSFFWGFSWNPLKDHGGSLQPASGGATSWKQQGECVKLQPWSCGCMLDQSSMRKLSWAGWHTWNLSWILGHGLTDVQHDQTKLICWGNLNVSYEFKQFSSNGWSLGVKHSLFIINLSFHLHSLQIHFHTGLGSHYRWLKFNHATVNNLWSSLVKFTLSYYKDYINYSINHNSFWICLYLLYKLIKNYVF